MRRLGKTYIVGEMDSLTKGGKCIPKPLIIPSVVAIRKIIGNEEGRERGVVERNEGYVAVGRYHTCRDVPEAPGP